MIPLSAKHLCSSFVLVYTIIRTSTSALSGVSLWFFHNDELQTVGWLNYVPRDTRSPDSAGT